MGNEDAPQGANTKDRLERVFAVGAIAFLAIALTLSEFGRISQQRANNSLSDELGRTRQEAEAALQAVISPEVLSNADASVYMVVDDQGYYGTAFVIDRERGLLATAAHVAEILPIDKENTSVGVLNRHSGKRLRVRARRIHSGYGAFRRVAEAYQPIDPQSLALAPKAITLSDFSNDAAILFVDPIDPETGENILGPALPIASEVDLLAITAGDPIAVVSFPSDVVTQPNAAISAASRVERGVVAATIAPIDIANDSNDPVARNLIVHRMATASGSSGGPMLNRKGEVVGVNTHGFDSVSSNGDGLAQRADVLYDLTGSLREEDVIEQVYRPEWEKRLSNWLRAKEVLPFTFFYRSAKTEKRKDLRLKLADAPLGAELPFRSRIIDLSFGKVRPKYAVLAPDLIEEEEQTENDNAHEAEEENDDNVVAVSQTPLFMIDQRGQYQEARFALRNNENHVIYAFDYAVSFRTIAFCPLAIYHRAEGETDLKIKAWNATPSVFISADPEAEGVTFHHVTFHRPSCPGATPGFFTGLVSWEDGAELPASMMEEADPSLLDHTSFIGHVSTMAAKLPNFACSFGLGEEDACVQPARLFTGADAVAVHTEALVDEAIPLVSISHAEQP